MALNFILVQTAPHKLLKYGHAYKLSVCAKVKMMDARECVLPRTTERYEMETFSPQNDRTTELNINFLLTATVYPPSLYTGT